MSPDDFTKTSPVERASMAVALVRGLDVPTVELVRALRDMPTPVFVVAEQLSEAEEVTLLHAGVHDVVRMTASPHLIGARLHAMFHHVHVGEPSQSPYEFANVSVRPDRHLVFVGDEEVPLTRTEFRLLVVLAQQHDRAVSREVLADLLHDSRHLAPHAIESHVSRLRTKIVEAGGPRLIESVRGVGYRLRVPS